MRKRARIFFSGSVQGVGFRFTTSNVARRFPVTGWVRNRADGRVEILVEGLEADIESFISGIEEEMNGYISGKVITWEGATGEWQNFTIAPTY